MRAAALVVLLLAGPAAAAGPGELEAQLDQARASEDEIGRVLAALKNPVAAEKACRAEFTAASVVDGVKTGGVPAAAFVLLPALKDGLAAHLSCKAAAAGDPAPCAGLEPLSTLPVGVPSTRVPQSLPPRYICQRDYQTVAYDLSRLGDGKDFAKRCLDENSYRWPGDEGPFRPDGWEKACAALAEYRAGTKKVEETCATLGPLFSRPGPAAECERRVRWFFGEDPALCDELRSEVAKRRCLDIAALKAELKAGAVKAADCAPALETARAAYCGRYTRDYAWRLHADLTVLLERASDLIGRASKRGGPAHPLAARFAKLETSRQDLAAALGVDTPADEMTPALPGAAFAEIDLDLGRAQSAALARELGAPPASCRAEFTLPALSAALDAGTVRGGREVTEPLEAYYACQARVLGAPAVCRELDRPAFSGADFPPQYRCRHNFLMWTADVARLTGTPDSPARCVAENYYRWRDPFDGGPFKPGAFREGCGIIADYSVRGADLKDVCGRIMPYFRYSTAVADCVDRFRYAHGQDLALCGSIKNPPVKLDRCQGLYALRRTIREGAPCGDSKYCRMQTLRTPETCGPYLAAVREAACAAGWNAPAPAVDAKALLDRAEKRLGALKNAPGEELERRRALVRWLRERVR